MDYPGSKVWRGGGENFCGQVVEEPTYGCGCRDGHAEPVLTRRVNERSE